MFDRSECVNMLSVNIITLCWIRCRQWSEKKRKVRTECEHNYYNKAKQNKTKQKTIKKKSKKKTTNRQRNTCECILILEWSRWVLVIHAYLGNWSLSISFRSVTEAQAERLWQNINWMVVRCFRFVSFLLLHLVCDFFSPFCRIRSVIFKYTCCSVCHFIYTR